MRLIADEMVSPKIVRIISETVLRKNWIFDPVRGSKYQGKADEDWLLAFARSGGNGLVSADRRMLKRPTLMRNISETGIVGIYLPAQWAGLRRNDQAAHILHWWPKIEKQFVEASAGTAWLVPKGLGNSDIRQHPLETGNGKKRREQKKSG